MSTLWVIGDSTVSSFEDKYYYPRYGYGTMLDKYLNDNVKVVNIALSGRSSKSYLSEPEYNTLINGMKQGDYLLIGFGHNDEKTEKERYTSPVGDYMTEGTFANTLYVNYIRKARNAGCYPILCTPIVRRSASGEWIAFFYDSRAGGNGSQGSQGPSQGRHPECPIRVPGQKDHGQSGSG